MVSTCSRMLLKEWRWGARSRGDERHFLWATVSLFVGSLLYLPSIIRCWNGPRDGFFRLSLCGFFLGGVANVGRHPPNPPPTHPCQNSCMGDQAVREKYNFPKTLGFINMLT